jgi:hypothetical protein
VVHVVVMMMVMVMVVMVMMVLHGSRRRSGRRGSRFLREGVTGQAERERGRGSEGLDHGKAFLCLGEPQRVIEVHKANRLNSI